MDTGRMMVLDQAFGDDWALYQADCCEALRGIPDESLGFSIYSPPFSNLYVYSDSERDMGNNTDGSFAEHYAHLLREIYRATKPGRNSAVHCMQLPSMKFKDGFIGLKDFRGEIIRAHQEAGWIFHSEVCIWKDPVTQMQRTKALGLLYKQVRKDSCMSRQGLPDYLCIFRKPGDNPDPVDHTPEEFPLDQWQRWASPVWMDINPGDTLQYQAARDNSDERHIAPLQLEVIRRALVLWSRPGDTVLSPFAGIGSEGHCAIGLGRRFVGTELKRSYYDQAVRNLQAAERERDRGQMPLFSEATT